MILYVDETENDEYFILTGLLLESQIVANQIYSSFKKKASNYKLSEDLKTKLFTEFKSVLMDKMFQSIKRKLIEEIKNEENVIIYSVYIKKDKKIMKGERIKLYTKMLIKIVNSIDQNINIIFDRNGADFDFSVISTISKLENVESINSADSQLVPGLQLVDNLCSIIRRKYSNSDIDNFYELIESNIRKV